MSILFFNKEKVAFIIDSINSKFWSIQVADEVSRAKMEQFTKNIKICMSVLTALIIMTVIFLICIPIISGNKSLIIPANYFFDETKRPYYEIILIMQFILLVYNASIITVSFDLLFIAIMTNIITQLKIIKSILSTDIGPDDRDTNILAQEKKDLEILKKCIDHHEFIIQ